MNSYVWGDNSFLRSEGIRDVDPQIVGERIEHLLSENGSSLTPDIVLADAENKESPLHAFFTQLTEDKARKWDLHTARVIMNSLRIVYVNTSGDEDLKYAVMSVRTEEDRRMREYRHIDNISVNPVSRASVLKEVRSQLSAIQRKYHYIESLSGLDDVIEQLKEEK